MSDHKKSIRYQWNDAAILYAANGRLHPTGRNVALILSEQFDWTSDPDNPELRNRNDRAAKYAGIAPSGMQEARKHLEAAGLIEVRKGHGGHRNWFAVLPDDLEEVKALHQERKARIREEEGSRPSANPKEAQTAQDTPAISKEPTEAFTEPVEVSQPVPRVTEEPSTAGAASDEAETDLNRYEEALRRLMRSGREEQRSYASEHAESILALAMEPTFEPDESDIGVRVQEAMHLRWSEDKFQAEVEALERDRERYTEQTPPRPTNEAGNLSGWGTGEVHTPASQTSVLDLSTW